MFGGSGSWISDDEQNDEETEVSSSARSESNEETLNDRSRSDEILYRKWREYVSEKARFEEFRKWVMLKHHLDFLNTFTAATIANMSPELRQSFEQWLDSVGRREP